MDAREENRYSFGMNNVPLVLTVSQLTAGIKELLETGFTDLVIEGEVSGLRSTSGKHLYFALKDEKALLKVVWFSWAARPGAVAPSDGDKVRAWGRLSVYEPQGQYQLVVSRLEAIGLGEILAGLETLKRRLESEGLFAPEKRRPLPLFPETIGLVTSPSGAALQDMLRIFLQNRTPSTLRIFPVLVQGQEAPSQIARILDYAGSHRLADVLIIGRGGGSLEDLLAFSDEAVVRAVARCAIPVVSAVGHETDSPLTDWAADVRAPTPTAAAEILSRPWNALRDTVSLRKEEMHSSLSSRLERAKSAVRDFRLERLEETFHRLVQPRYQRLDDAKELLLGTWKERLTDVRSRLSVSRASLEALDPLAVLDRGYALVTDEKGNSIARASETRTDQVLGIRWKDGEVHVKVKETNS